MKKENGYMLLAFLAFCFAQRACESGDRVMHAARDGLTQVMDWDTAAYLASAVGGLMLLGLPILVLIWLVAKIIKWA